MKIKELPYRNVIQWSTLPLVPVVIIGGISFPMLGWISITLLMGMIVSTFFRGRQYCGWVCPMGGFHERVLSKISMNKPMHPIFKSKVIRWFLFALMMGLLGQRLYAAGSDIRAIGGAFVMMWTISTVLAIGIGLYWQPRTWCSICPMATFQGSISPCTYLLKVDSSCTECSICRKSCPIDTAPMQFKENGYVPGGECMRCGNCVASCPKSALEFEKGAGVICKQISRLRIS